ncbi:ras-related protein Rab-43-like [Daphnia pulex]|uniref:ras-related protein Rab-43-like n=1 Tax=Daphnia pulex TaxID=6669 RepID=UPI001EDE5662|nr:ras-related protein Rab-43-like [Daphnia pulex]XP_046442563.1 ras-related protein Rab-43-like [Daphnia pulex]
MSRLPSNTASEESFDFLFKIVVIGDCGIGKTSLVQRFKSGVFTERYTNTIGVDFAMKTVVIEGKQVKLQIWDTAGQERFRTITQSYYRSANGVLLVYDITKRSSFLSLQKWMEEIRRFTANNISWILIGNKCDMDTLREVEQVEALAMAELIPEIVLVLETSAKDNTNVEQAFVELATELKRNQCGLGIHDAEQQEVFNLNTTRILKSKQCSACSI